MSVRAQLQLEHFRLHSLHIECNPAWLAQEAASQDRVDDYRIQPDFSIFERNEEDDDVAPGGEQVMVRLSISCEPIDENRTTRFSLIHIEVWGLFTLAPDTPEEYVEQLKGWNSVAILHGIARGQVMQATGTCYDGPFILPSLNYMAQTSRTEQDHVGQDDAECVDGHQLVAPD